MAPDTTPQVDAYLLGLEEPRASTLRELRSTLRAVLPDAEERLSYGVPAFAVDGTPVAGYAAFKAHCGYYPHSGSVLERAADMLEGHEWSAGTLKFPIDQPLPEPIVRRLVELRLEELDAG
ncbi:MAG: DUF1801 domain-containing protein [Acidimicrobiia bacterium]|nr:DUF1801 domain-containing protein [Acidimicrobiia bacterium]